MGCETPTQCEGLFYWSHNQKFIVNNAPLFGPTCKSLQMRLASPLGQGWFQTTGFYFIK